MKSLNDFLHQSAEQVGNLKATLENARSGLLALKEQFPDASDDIDAKIAELDAEIAKLDAPVEPEALLALSIACLKEIRGFGRLQFTPTPHAGSGI